MGFFSYSTIFWHTCILQYRFDNDAINLTVNFSINRVVPIRRYLWIALNFIKVLQDYFWPRSVLCWVWSSDRNPTRTEQRAIYGQEGGTQRPPPTSAKHYPPIKIFFMKNEEGFNLVCCRCWKLRLREDDRQKTNHTISVATFYVLCSMFSTPFKTNFTTFNFQVIIIHLGPQKHREGEYNF